MILLLNWCTCINNTNSPILYSAWKKRLLHQDVMMHNICKCVTFKMHKYNVLILYTDCPPYEYKNHASLDLFDYNRLIIWQCGWPIVYMTRIRLLPFEQKCFKNNFHFFLYIFLINSKIRVCMHSPMHKFKENIEFSTFKLEKTTKCISCILSSK